ncbi:restriction endonuclease subunit S [Sinorhizobium saheli]|uniref:Type I restriction modification DNA specificity domain-containing protein n=1 Tax=Sinorhizobium saheli TaxID=36856 RepID=A0A178Y632_SINSA|nr:restriction endonuclease subunit S [Sinorhizobium saheli]MQW87810.1 hypothetical protein [Sinorhizobium saheli]OAP43020.1 hypothetical protein ATB98_15320 [Sinorhizobium saheli]
MLELKEVANILTGVAVQEAGDGPARFVRLSDLSELRCGRIPNLATGEEPAVARAWAIDEGDLIVGARGAATDACLASQSVVGAYISLDLYLVRPDPSKIDPGYLAAFLELPTTQAALAGSKQGSGLARLPKDALEKIRVPLPPMQKQQLVAGLASCVRAEADLLKRLIELNSILGREALARAICASTPPTHS